MARHGPTNLLAFISLASIAAAGGGEGEPWSPEQDGAPAAGVVHSEHADHGAAGHVHHGGWAPIGVMGDHVHGRGEWMFSLRYVRMTMDGNLDGTDSVSRAEIHAQGFPVAPLSMDMNMLMAGFMYGLTDTWTLAAMIPYVDLSMDLRTMAGVDFTTRAAGVGDVRAGALWKFWDSGEHHRAHLNAMFSAPTGSIDEKDQTPASGGADVQLPYPMQLGSGTWDLLPGITYLGNAGDWSWGAQWIQTLRLGENERDYTLGDRSDLTAWAARDLSPTTSLSLRAAGARWGNIDGADPDLNPGLVPTADPDLRAGTRVDLLAGFGWHGASGNRFTIEVGTPVYQDLDGPQLATDLVLVLGWQLLR